ncbi:MAG TPA: GTP-binding protein [Burkholderiaceae bacterium]|nr:GTP-binding protein [Burkholderiaceae bacterium]
MADSRAVPLTVIGGFLGAGKTTLLNALLAQTDDRRIAVLVNDFGDLQIDAALIAQSTATTISLRNGCVCCSLAGGLINALSESLAIDPRPDHVVVEASGVSDPRRIAQVARSGAGFSPEATVVVVATDQIEELACDRYVGDTVTAQLAAADLLILSKIDLVDASRKPQVRQWLATSAPHATLIEALNGDVPIELVLGPTAQAVSLRGLKESDHGDHGERFTAHVFRCAMPLGETKLNSVIQQLPPGVFRLKGLVRLDSNPQRLRLVQGVRTRCSISDAPPHIEQEGSTLVVIGAKGLLNDSDLAGMRDLFNGH